MGGQGKGRQDQEAEIGRRRTKRCGEKHPSETFRRSREERSQREKRRKKQAVERGERGRTSGRLQAAHLERGVKRKRNWSRPRGRTLSAYRNWGDKGNRKAGEKGELLRGGGGAARRIELVHGRNRSVGQLGNTGGDCDAKQRREKEGRWKGCGGGKIRTSTKHDAQKILGTHLHVSHASVLKRDSEKRSKSPHQPRVQQFRWGSESTSEA